MADGFSFAGGVGVATHGPQSYGQGGVAFYKILREDNFLLRLGGIFNRRGAYDYPGSLTSEETNDPAEVLSLARQRDFDQKLATPSIVSTSALSAFDGYREAYLVGPSFSLFRNFFPNKPPPKEIGVGLSATVEAGLFQWEKYFQVSVNYLKPKSQQCCDNFFDSWLEKGWTPGIEPHADIVAHIGLTTYLSLELNLPIIGAVVTGENKEFYFIHGASAWLLYTWGGERFFKRKARSKDLEYERNKKSAQLEEIISEFRKKGKQASDSNSLDQAFFFYNAGLRKAEEWFDLVKGTEKESAAKEALFDIRFQMSAIQFKRGLYDAEIESLKLFLEKYPDYVDAYYSLGTLFHRKEEYSESIRLLEHFLLKAPKNKSEKKKFANAYNAHYFLGFAYYFRASQTKLSADKASDLRKSLQQFNKALLAEGLDSNDFNQIQETIKAIQKEIESLSSSQNRL